MHGRGVLCRQAGIRDGRGHCLVAIPEHLGEGRDVRISRMVQPRLLGELQGTWSPGRAELVDAA